MAIFPETQGLLAGAARVEITPRLRHSPQFLDGYGNRSEPSEGVYLPIFARALYLEAGGEAALVVSAEALAYDPAQVERIRAEIAAAAGVAPEKVILTATHTHCAPRVCESMVMPGSIDPEYVAWFEERLVAAAVVAVRAAAPVSAALSRCEDPLGVNRRVVTPTGTGMRPNSEGVCDPTVATLWLTSGAGGRPDMQAGRLRSQGRPDMQARRLRSQGGQLTVGSLTVYACHPTCRGGQLVGGDYPGFFSRDMEATSGTAIFCLGCAGDIRPRFSTESGSFRQAELPEVEAAGSGLAVRARAAPREELAVEAVRVRGERIPLPFARLPDEDELERIARQDPKPLWRSWAERMLASLPLPSSLPFEIQVLALSPAAAWVFMAGEMVVDYARALSRPAGPSVVAAGYANGSVGYVPSRRIYPEGGYEVNGSHYYYGQPAPFAPECEEIVLGSARRLVAGALEEAR